MRCRYSYLASDIVVYSSTWVIALITLMLRALTSLYMYCFDSANVKGVVVHKATIGMNYLIE